MKKTKKTYTKINPTTQLFLAIGLFIVSVWATNGNDLATWEIKQFMLIYDLPTQLQPLFFVITQFGSIYVLGLLLIIYLVKKRYHIVLRMLMTGTLAYLMAGFAKDIWGRGRPTELLQGVVNLDYIVRGPGFPSGHMALATALALTAGHYLPRKYHWLAAVWIVGVGLSRMYLGVHLPLDIVGGFAIGWASYALFRHVRLYDVSFSRKHTAKAKAPSRNNLLKLAR